MATKSKMGKCRTIFDNMTAAGKARKDIIAKFVSSAGATPAGAATYYQKLKNPTAPKETPAAAAGAEGDKPGEKTTVVTAKAKKTVKAKTKGDVKPDTAPVAKVDVNVNVAPQPPQGAGPETAQAPQ